MSYVRFGEYSNLYIFDHVDGGICCCGCLFERNAAGTFTAQNHNEMIEHVRFHINAGHNVPEYVIPELERRRDGK